MTLKIEAGKFYRRADGQKAGPAENDGSIVMPWNVPVRDGLEHWYHNDGRSSAGPQYDLMAEWTDEPAAPEVGTLRELGVKPGDVVEIVYEPFGDYIGETAKIDDEGCAIAKDSGAFFWPEYDDKHKRKYRIISRASEALPYGHARLPSGKVVDLTAIEKPFGLLDEDVKQAMRDHGGPYEVYGTDGWLKCDPLYATQYVYRVDPKPPEPVVGEVVMIGSAECGFGDMQNQKHYDTHILTLPTRDGQLVAGTYTGPDGLVIKVEAL